MMIDAAIMAPGVIVPVRASDAPTPSIATCSTMRTVLELDRTTPPRSLARACWPIALACWSAQRACTPGCMPMGCTASALRRLVWTKPLAVPLA